MKHLKVLLLMSLFCLVFFAGCGSAQAGQDPTTLQVTRMDQLSKDHPGLHSWTITDAHAVQQLFQEIPNLPEHQNHGADTCARPRYTYTLEFLAGTKRLQKDELYTYCFTLTLEDGSQRDPTATFDSLLSGMLHLSVQDLRGW